MEDLIAKAQGYDTKHTGSGGPAEAVAHSVQGAPSGDESKKEKNAANSGTHIKSGGTPGSSNRPEGGEDFKDGGAAEDEIQTPKGSGGRAPQARPGTIKHEGGQGGATLSAKSEGEADLEKGFPPAEKKDDDKGSDEKGESKEDEKKEHEGGDDKDDKDEKSEKSVESGEVLLDIDEFATEITKSVTEKVLAFMEEKFGETVQKSKDSEYIEAGLAKSIAATLDRVEELEKAVVNVANAMNIRKSLLKSSDNIKGIDNPSLNKTSLTKSEVSSKLLDMQMSGQFGVDTNMVLKFDGTGDYSVLPPVVKSKLGIEE